MKALNSIIGALVVVSATAFSTPSNAAIVLRSTITNGSVACSGTTSNYQNMLTTRAEGRRNSGSTNTSMVTCGGAATPMNMDGDVVAYEIGFNNASPNSITVNCSLVDGLGAAGGTDSKVLPKMVVIPAGGAAYIDWNSGDNGGTGWDSGPFYIYPSLTCNLPPKAEIAYTAIIYRVDVGN
jgi:hypothetical protein